MNRAVMLFSLVVLAVPSGSEAQRRGQETLAAGQLSEDSSASWPRGQKITARTIVGTGAMALGGVAGGYLGYMVETSAAGQNCYDFCGFGGMLLGFGIGGLVGTAIGVASPVRSHCSWSDRFGRALGGAALGAIAGGAAAALLQKAPVIAVPVATVTPALTAALMQGKC